MSTNQFRRHRKARIKINEIFTHPERVRAIHYSCESFYDRPDGSSPRVTSIAIRNLDSGQTISFSIHQMAELEGISLDNIDEHYDSLEKKMLDCLADYLQKHVECTWLHWNMRDQNYGFQAIEHRHRVLRGKPYIVPDDRKVDLSRLFIALYGVGYIGHPRLENLLRKNNIEALDFLSGAEEAVAFNEKRYVDLHRSTLRKVDVFCNIAERAYDGKLQTNSSWREARGISSEALLTLVKEHPLYTAASVVATVSGSFGIFKLF